MKHLNCPEPFRIRQGLILHAFLLTVSFGTAACSVDVDLDREGFPCNGDGQCERGLICVQGVCVRDLCAEVDCDDDGSICIDGICVQCETLDGSCLEPGFIECLDDMSGFRICGHFSEDFPDCLVWSETEVCTEQEVCMDGDCLPCGDSGEPCCRRSVCNDGLQCNLETEICEPYTCTGPTEEDCGNCGTRTRTCHDGEWSDWGICTGEGECTPRMVNEQDCGEGGTQTRTCTVSCAWEEWGECTGEYEGVWTDPESGLTWQLVSPEQNLDHGQAIAYCEELGLAGGDWRLPTISDLRSLLRGCPPIETGGGCNVGEGCLAQACRDHSCDGCSFLPPTGDCFWPEALEGECCNGWHWSSSLVEGGGTGVWGVTFMFADVAAFHGPSPHGSVRCVRSTCEPWTCEDLGLSCGGHEDNCGGFLNCGPCPGGHVCEHGRCEPEPEEAAWTDPATGLTWQVRPTGGPMNFSAAIAYCEGLTLADATWRLPTISELRTLIRGCPLTETEGDCAVADECMTLSCRDSSCDACSYDKGPTRGCYWPDVLGGICDWYWSSTLVGDTTDEAWYVNYFFADVSHYYTVGVIYQVRCVR